MAGQTTSEAVAAHGVSKRFRGTPEVVALDDVSVTIGKNEFFTLLGPSGCGKTTLLRLIAGFDHPSAGRITLGGEEISHLPPYRRPVNTVFQNYALFPHLSVAENIGFGLQMLGQPKDEISRTVDEMLHLVRMEALKDRRTSEISGGQQQRVALARALSPHPEVLLLDEPLSALDLKLRKEMQVELKRLQNETGITFIFVTHDQEEALTMSDRIAVMSEGRILQVGTPREIYDHPRERFVADFIGDTNFVTAEVTRTGTEEIEVAFLGTTLPARLPEGTAPGRGQSVTVAIRPEHARLAAENAGHLNAIVEDAVYVGTDTHVHLELTDGTRFTTRVQNSAGGALPAVPGQTVGLSIDPGSIQVLRD